MKVKAAYFLGDGYYDKVYEPVVRKEIEELADVAKSILTPENWRKYPEITTETEWLLSGWGMTPITEELLQAFPNLKVIFYAGGSIKSVMTESAWKRGIIITSGYAANAVPVAEFTVAQIILASKHAWRFFSKIRSTGRYPTRHEPPGMYGTTVGIISLGMIGRSVAERLKSFDVSVIAYDPLVPEDQATASGVKLVTLDEVFELSDIVSCHLPHLKETEGMLCGEHFRRMKFGATFINTARGIVVNEPELADVLCGRPDLWALLDVTYPEPPADESPLLKLPNIVVTPHIAGSMSGERGRLGRYMVEEIKRFLAGEPLSYQMTQAQVARMA